MNTSEQEEKRQSAWIRYFIEPGTYAKKATAISRNILNIGLTSLITGLIIYGPHVSQYQFAYRDLPSDYLASLSTRDGGYRFITGGKSSSPRYCVVDPISGKELACSGKPLGSSPSGAEKNFAVAWIDPQYGVVRITLNDLEILSPTDIQARLRKGIMNFGGLFFVFLACLTIAIFRQVSLVSAQQKKIQ